MDPRRHLSDYRAPGPGRRIWTPPPLWTPALDRPRPPSGRPLTRWSPGIAELPALHLATIANVGAGSAFGTDDTLGTALATNSVSHTSGNLLVAVGIGGASLTFTFSGGGTTGWHSASGVAQDAGGSLGIGYAVCNSTSSFAVTMTPNTNCQYRRVFVMEFSCDTGWPADPLATYATGKGKTTSTTQTSNATGAAATADNLVVAGFSEWYTHTSWTATGSPSTMTNARAVSGEDICVQYLIRPTAASQSGGVNVNSGTDNSYVAACCAFNVAVTVALDQSHARWRNDDGDEAGATWAEDEDAQLTAPAGTMRARAQINNTGDPAAITPQFDWRLKPSGGAFGAWRKVR